MLLMCLYYLLFVSAISVTPPCEGAGEAPLQLALLESFCILGYHELINAVLNVTVHEGCKIIDGVIDAVVGDASQRIVVGADLCRAVTG